MLKIRGISSKAAGLLPYAHGTLDHRDADRRRITIAKP